MTENNVRLSAGVVAIAVLVGTMWGPLNVLKDVTSAQLDSRDYWLAVLAATIQSFAATALSTASLLAGVLGIPLLRGKVDQKATAPPKPP